MITYRQVKGQELKENEMKTIKVEWCENFIKSIFEKHKCKGIYTELFWDLAEKSGLWERGTYGSPMSKALLKLTKVESVTDDNGNYLYTIFKLA